MEMECSSQRTECLSQLPVMAVHNRPLLSLWNFGLICILSLCNIHPGEGLLVNSTVYEIDNIIRTALPRSIREPVRFENIMFRDNTFHLYGVSDMVRKALKQNGGHLARYKRFFHEKQLFDIPTPKLELHREMLDTDVICTAGIRREIAMFYSPWHVDNMFHLHNDNILALVDTVRHTPGCQQDTLECDLELTLYQFKGDPARKPVKAEEALGLIFDNRRHSHMLYEQADQTPICFSRVVWGRGPCFMYEVQQAPSLLRRAQAAVAALRWKAFHKLEISSMNKQTSSSKHVVYISRGHSGPRSIGNITTLMDECRRTGAICTECCDWKQNSFKRTLQKIAHADVLMGPHGAGLTNILYAQPGASLVQFAHGAPWKPIFTIMTSLNNGGVFTNIEIGKGPWSNVSHKAVQQLVEAIT